MATQSPGGRSAGGGSSKATIEASPPVGGHRPRDEDAERRRREERENRHAWMRTFALFALAVVVGVAAVVFAMNVDSLISTKSTDASVSGGDATGWLLTIVTILISGVYVFTTFRIDRGVKTQAKQEANDVANEVAEKEVKIYLKESAEDKINNAVAMAEASLKEMECQKNKSISRFERLLSSEGDEIRKFRTDIAGKHGIWMKRFEDQKENQANTVLTKIKSNAEKCLQNEIDSIQAQVAGVEPVEDLRGLIAEIVDEDLRRRTFLERLFPRSKPKAKRSQPKGSAEPKGDADNA